MGDEEEHGDNPARNPLADDADWKEVGNAEEWDDVRVSSMSLYDNYSSGLKVS
jgi:hypothetical protein